MRVSVLIKALQSEKKVAGDIDVEFVTSDGRVFSVDSVQTTSFPRIVLSDFSEDAL